MASRYAYWTIILDGLPTAFRAARRESLLPTLKQLQSKNPEATLRWFARGRLWESPDEARREFADRGRAGQAEKRSRDWRPGGDHEDRRLTFKRKQQEARQTKKTAREDRNRFFKEATDRRPQGDRPGRGGEARPWGRDRAPSKGPGRPPWDRDRPRDARAPRPWERDRSPRTGSAPPWERDHGTGGSRPFDRDRHAGDRRPFDRDRRPDKRTERVRHADDERDTKPAEAPPARREPPLPEPPTPSTEFRQPSAPRKRLRAPDPGDKKKPKG